MFIGGSMSESSKKLYNHNLTRLNDGKELKDFNFLKKTDQEVVLIVCMDYRQM